MKSEPGLHLATVSRAMQQVVHPSCQVASRDEIAPARYLRRSRNDERNWSVEVCSVPGSCACATWSSILPAILPYVQHCPFLMSSPQIPVHVTSTSIRSPSSQTRGVEDGSTICQMRATRNATHPWPILITVNQLVNLGSDNCNGAHTPRSS